MAVELISCASCSGTGIYDGECRWCKGSGKRPRRLEGYYIGFDPTGSHAIDKILGAVACAGKAYHHTECWEDETPPYDDHTGNRPSEWIQNAAIEAARLIAAAPDLLEALEAVSEALHEVEAGYMSAFEVQDIARAAIAKAKGET
ncbi:hypothetical protein [Hyphomonas sp.]|uniref:hypothetical protein n=1 Tax=Hyphomonas sp. TaxID=87 RepID=UPI00260B907A|nr:hypothetical protein [Hyphomonas sp.]MDF1807946.1 hypothetical protein [Hyphomonas sp.]